MIVKRAAPILRLAFLRCVDLLRLMFMLVSLHAPCRVEIECSKIRKKLVVSWLRWHWMPRYPTVEGCFVGNLQLPDANCPDRAQHDHGCDSIQLLSRSSSEPEIVLLSCLEICGFADRMTG